MEHFDFTGLNVWAILVASLLNMGLGSIWYSSMLFGNQWMNGLGLKRDELKPSAGLFIGTYLLGLVIAFVMAVLLKEAGSALVGLIYGAVIAVGFIIPTLVTHYLYEGRKGNVIMIISAHELVLFLVYGALLGGWS